MKPTQVTVHKKKKTNVAKPKQKVINNNLFT
jgi:hypothetical protein